MNHDVGQKRLVIHIKCILLQLVSRQIHEHDVTQVSFEQALTTQLLFCM